MEVRAVPANIMKGVLEMYCKVLFDNKVGKTRSLSVFEDEEASSDSELQLPAASAEDVAVMRKDTLTAQLVLINLLIFRCSDTVVWFCCARLQLHVDRESCVECDGVKAFKCRRVWCTDNTFTN